MKAEISRVTARLRKPFVTSGGELLERDLLVLRLEDEEGNVGWGEAAPLGVPVELVRSELESGAPALAPARAAYDMALCDMAARREGVPVWRLFGTRAAGEIEVNATIASADRAGAAAEAADAAREGYACVKVKVGLGDDAGRVAAVRAAAGGEMEVRLDANGAWTPAEALAALHALEPAGIELCEEPVHGLEGVAEVARGTLVPISIDESSSEPGALEERRCDAVCLKIAPLGGITGLVEAARLARAAGYEVYLASMLDGPLGIAAALHAAAVVRADRPCGLATLELFKGPESPLPVRGGRIAVPDGPGLGAGLLEWYR